MFTTQSEGPKGPPMGTAGPHAKGPKGSPMVTAGPPLCREGGRGERGNMTITRSISQRYHRDITRSGAVKPCLQFKVTAMLPLDTVISLTSIPARGKVTIVSLAEQVAEVIHTGGSSACPG